MVEEPGFDFAEFDAVAADLDLEVVAADEFDGAVGEPAAQVSGAVEACAVSGEPVGYEAFGGEGGASEVSAGDAEAADEQFTGYAYGAGRPRLSTM